MLLKFTIEDHDTLFVLAEATHFIGIGLLGFKLLTKKSVAGQTARPHWAAHRPQPQPQLNPTPMTCPCPSLPCLPAGLSLRSQELTGIFLGLRLVCSFLMEKDIHTLLDGLTLAATAAVIYGMRFTAVRQTYQKEQDTVKLLYVVRAPCHPPACLPARRPPPCTPVNA